MHAVTYARDGDPGDTQFNPKRINQAGQVIEDALFHRVPPVWVLSNILT